ncbi:MAG: AcvB/VirJ family lysyl-phosphatidylglycerol hydrolase [Verrucomicrobiota bacterium]
MERTGRLLFWGEMLMVAGFVVYRIVTGILEPPTIIGTAVIPTAQPARTSETVRLTRGDYALYRYAPGDPALAAHPKALIIFGSGDGGADGWEDRVCRALQADGYEVISFDCARYAVTDYDLPTLQADMAALARSLPHDPPVPLILGGWSMGAEQAVAAAGGPDRSPNLAGLLLVSPGSRGRYGLRSPDRWNVPPKGAGTFALTDFATKLGGLRVAQWDGRLDLLDSTAWLNGVTTTHKTFSYTLGFHDYGGASDEFLNQVKQSVAWILSSGP